MRWSRREMMETSIIILDCRGQDGTRETKEEAVRWSRREMMEAGPGWGQWRSRVQILHRVCEWSPQGQL